MKARHHLLAALPLLACLLCPAHVLLIAGFLGFSMHVQQHHDEDWRLLAGSLVSSVILLVYLERRHHRRHCNHNH